MSSLSQSCVATLFRPNGMTSPPLAWCVTTSHEVAPPRTTSRPITYQWGNMRITLLPMHLTPPQAHPTMSGSHIHRSQLPLSSARCNSSSGYSFFTADGRTLLAHGGDTASPNDIFGVQLMRPDGRIRYLPSLSSTLTNNLMLRLVRYNTMTLATLLSTIL